MLIDIVNDNNEPIDVIDRSEVLERGQNFRTVHAWLVDSDGQIILQRLAKSHPRSPEQLGSSVAGYLNAGETYDDAINRKMDIEIGSKSADLHMLGTITMTDLHSKKFVTLYTGSLHTKPPTQDTYIENFAYLPLKDLEHALKHTPESFTATFKVLYEKFGTEFLQKLQRR